MLANDWGFVSGPAVFSAVGYCLHCLCLLSTLPLSADPSLCLNAQLSNKCLQDALECAADVQVFHVFAYEVYICVRCQSVLGFVDHEMKYSYEMKDIDLTLLME